MSIENGIGQGFIASQELVRPTFADLQRFTQPRHDTSQEAAFLHHVGAEYYPKKRSGLVIGRFQPLHYGHIYNWKMALAISESIVIAIGSADKFNDDNPFSAIERERMVRDALVDHGLSHRVSKVVHLNDYKEDAEWFQEAQRLTGGVDVVVGNNEWVNGLYESAGLAAFRPPLLERGIYEGKKCRAELRLNGKLPQISS